MRRIDPITKPMNRSMPVHSTNLVGYMLWTCHAGYFHLHLISDSAGETLITVARSGRADQQRRGKSDGKMVSPVTISFIELGLGRKKDQRPETGAAFRAVPNVTGVPIAPVLGPFGRNQRNASS